MKKTAAILLPLLLITTLLYLPILLNPDLLLERGNDLQEFFWPIFYFVKQQLIKNHTLPLWNNLFLSGTPLLPDPQAPLFYLPNIIFLILPIGVGFIVSMFFHTLIGGIGAYLVARHGFKFSKNASFFASFLYILTPRVAGYLEAGHFGLVAASAWLPFVLLATIKLVKKPTISWLALLAISLSGLFYTHPVTFIYSGVLVSIAFTVTTIFLKRKKLSAKPFAFFAFGAILTFGLIAISFLPQLEWAPQTSRVVLVTDRQIWPKWHSLAEFLKAVFVPWWTGMERSWKLDAEKWIVLGITPVLLAIYGFFRIKNKWLKMGLAIMGAIIILIALNNASPLYGFLVSQNWFVYTRVATRIWFVTGLIITFLAAFAYQILEKKWGGKALKILIVIAIIELTIISWTRILKPSNTQSRFASKEVLEFLSADKDRFRVFCTNRCISQKDAAKYDLELVEGYSTLIQMNYYQHAWQLTGTYWNYYTLAIPPIGSYKFEDLQPDAASLGDYNTKYVISPHELEDENFILEKEIDNYLIYRNTLLKPRVSAPISIYTPNYIRVDTSNFSEKQLILSEVYNSGWKAYLNGKEEVVVQETPIALRAVDITPETKFVDFKYQPDSYKWGRIITLTTLLTITFHFISKKKGLFQ